MKGLLFGLLAGSIAMFAAQDAMAYNKKITLRNHTAYNMTGFYASNVGQRNWTFNMLQGRVLAPGASVNADLDDGSNYCMYDLKANFENGSHAERYRFDACKEASWTVVP